LPSISKLTTSVPSGTEENHRYESCILDIATEYGAQPSRPLSELEVIIGNILGRTGAQSRKEHELSVSMRDRFSEDLAYIVNCILKDGREKSAESLAQSIACFEVSLEPVTTALRSGVGLVSFRYVAAAVCLKEVDLFLSG
jgi:hypothetical protein